MSGKKATGKTIGEVEKLTGIPKRTLKYFIEQKLVRPSQKSESGYWLYSNEDIWKAQLASLCWDLDFPIPVIRNVLTDPSDHWQKELERQIICLADKKTRIETQLARARSLRLNWKSEEWASLLQQRI